MAEASTSAHPARGPSAPPVDDDRPSPLRMLGPALLGLVAVVLSGALIFRTAARFRPKPPQDLGTLPAFTLTDQAGRAFTERDLAGKAWVVDFFFSRCTGVCPVLAERMRQVGRFLDGDPRYGPRTGLLSISVDHEYDTPARLAEYAKQQRVDAARWRMVTGSSQAIEDVIVKGFHVGMGRPVINEETGKMEILHGGHLVLLDPRGHIRGYYDTDDEGLKSMRADLARILDEQPGDAPPPAPAPETR